MRESRASELSAANAQGRTSFHVRRILREPDEESWLWLVQRLNPLLELQARYRLRGAAEGLCDPQDLINETWLVAFMRLDSLVPRNGRWTPVLLEFLSTTLLHKVNEVLRKELRRRSRRASAAQGEDDDAALPSGMHPMTSVMSRAARSEHECVLSAALARLDPAEREVVVLRGIEQRSNGEVASLLGQKPSTIAMRWARALEHLRRVLPDSLLEELTEA